MTQHLNALGQPVGSPLSGWMPPILPSHERMEGRFCRLEPLQAERHAEALFAANASETDGRSWTYLPYGPFTSLADYRAWMEQATKGTDPLFFAIIDQADQQPVGVAAYLRIAPTSGAIEVGHLHFSQAMKQTPVATEAMYLMMERAFALGYRRYEWKCDVLNAASRAAAERLGFRFEGIFRQATVYKQRSRDTAWFSIIDKEWLALQGVLQQWLAPGNFDANGRQLTRLSDLTRALPAASA